MLLPLQMGLPGGPELVIIFLLFALMLVPATLIGLVVVFLLVRSDDGNGAKRASGGGQTPRESRDPERGPDDPYAERGPDDSYDSARRDRDEGTATDESVHRDADSAR